MSRAASSFITLALAVLAGRAMPSELLSELPLEVPFAAQTSGTVVELNIRVREQRGYSFLLQLGITSEPGSRARIAKLAGSGSRGPDGKPVNDGLPIPVELTIWRLPLSSLAPVYQNRASEFDLASYSAGYYAKEIATVPLAPGSYRVRLQALQDLPELKNAPMKLAISYRRK